MAIHLKVTAHPDSNKESVMKGTNSRLIIHVKESATDNQANRRILEIIRGLHPGSAVKMIKGHHTASKIIYVEE
jgi:uncharacterized protein YggU (UPF0235/DUF167 family)